jgi:hypothetical protein
MIELPLPPAAPRDTLDPVMAGYLMELLRWQEELVRVVQLSLNDLNRNYNRQGDPIAIPGATVTQLTSAIPTYSPAKPSTGGTRLAYATDATGGAKVVYSDGAAWREIDGGVIVT